MIKRTGFNGGGGGGGADVEIIFSNAVSPCVQGSTRMDCHSLKSSKQMEQVSTVSFALWYFLLGSALTCQRESPRVRQRMITTRHCRGWAGKVHTEGRERVREKGEDK